MARQTRTPEQAPSTPEPTVAFNRSERTLAFMVAGVFGVSLLCMIIVIVGWLTIKTIPGTGIWPLVTVLPEVGFPLGMLLVFALLAVTWVKRARQNKDGSR